MSEQPNDKHVCPESAPRESDTGLMLFMFIALIVMVSMIAMGVGDIKRELRSIDEKVTNSQGFRSPGITDIKSNYGTDFSENSVVRLDKLLERDGFVICTTVRSAIITSVDMTGEVEFQPGTSGVEGSQYPNVRILTKEMADHGQSCDDGYHVDYSYNAGSAAK